MNKDQGTGIIERVIYGAVIFLVAKFGSQLGLTTEDGAWLAGGAVILASGTWAWWHNRPVSVLNRAAEAIPDQAKLVITTLPAASHVEKLEASALANAASPRVFSANA